VERSVERVQEIEDVLYKLDKQLRKTRGASSDNITECQFVDDVALLPSTREAAEAAINVYQSIGRSLGLTISLPKTKVYGCWSHRKNRTY